MTEDQHPTLPAMFISSLTATTAEGLTPWHRMDDQTSVARTGVFEATITRSDDLAEFTMVSEPDHRFRANSYMFPELLDLADMAAESARTRRRAVLDIARELYADVPEREIPTTTDDPDGRHRLLAAATFATHTGGICWSRVDDRDRTTRAAALPQDALIQMDLYGPRNPDPAKTILLMTVHQHGAILTTVTESSGHHRSDYPLITLFSAITQRKRLRARTLIPDLEKPTGNTGVDELLQAFFGSLS